VSDAEPGSGVERLVTLRMTGERLRDDHAPELIALLGDPRVWPTLWPDPDGPTEADVIDGLQTGIEHWRVHGFGLWLLRDRHTGAPVGRGGLQRTHVAGRDEVEVAWAIVPERWGEGLATELAGKAIEVGVGDLGLDELVAFTLPHNAASRRVMEKAGFAYERDTEHAGLPHVLYRLRSPP
jgi:ribosomal-protein-alanine N-acetyltransferase